MVGFRKSSKILFVNRIVSKRTETDIFLGLNTKIDEFPLSTLLVRGGGHCLCSREFYSPGNGDLYNPN